MTSNHTRFQDSHEWANPENDRVVVIGISDFAQDSLGDVVFVELPNVGDIVDVKQEIATVESVKAVSAIYSPVSGTISEINENLIEQPELINQSPYDQGWLYKLTISADSIDTSLAHLLDEKTYQELISQ